MYGKFGCGVTHEQAVEEFNGGKTVVQIARKYGKVIFAFKDFPFHLLAIVV